MVEVNPKNVLALGTGPVTTGMCVSPWRERQKNRVGAVYCIFGASQVLRFERYERVPREVLLMTYDRRGTGWYS